MANDKLIYRQKCYSTGRISQATVIAMMPEGSRQREFFQSLDPEKWTITSFDSRLREVCIDLETDSGTNKMSVTLPYIDITPTDFP